MRKNNGHEQSGKLTGTSYLLYQKFKKLNAKAGQFFIGIINVEEGVNKIYVTIHGSKLMKKSRL